MITVHCCSTHAEDTTDNGLITCHWDCFSFCGLSIRDNPVLGQDFFVDYIEYGSQCDVCLLLILAQEA